MSQVIAAPNPSNSASTHQVTCVLSDGPSMVIRSCTPVTKGALIARRVVAPIWSRNTHLNFCPSTTWPHNVMRSQLSATKVEFSWAGWVTRFCSARFRYKQRSDSCPYRKMMNINSKMPTCNWYVSNPFNRSFPKQHDFLWSGSPRLDFLQIHIPFPAGVDQLGLQDIFGVP